MNINDVKKPAMKKNLKIGRYLGHIVWHRWRSRLKGAHSFFDYLEDSAASLATSNGGLISVGMGDL